MHLLSKERALQAMQLEGAPFMLSTFGNSRMVRPKSPHVGSVGISRELDRNEWKILERREIRSNGEVMCEQPVFYCISKEYTAPTASDR